VIVQASQRYHYGSKAVTLYCIFRLEIGVAEVNDWDKSKAHLIEELAALRAEVTTLKQQSRLVPHGQSVPTAQTNERLVSRRNGVSVLGRDLAPDSLDLTERATLRAAPVNGLQDLLNPLRNEEPCFQLSSDHDCLQPEQLLNSFFGAAAHSNLGLLILDTDLRFLRLNRALAEMNGYSVEAHLGKPVQELLPELAPTLTPLLTSIIETGESVSNLEISGYTPCQPNSLRHWVTAFFPITNAAGQVVAIGGSVREVTEFRQLLVRLQEHEFNWQTAQRIAHVAG
jgi:PAS domain S-box-containing protein